MMDSLSRIVSILWVVISLWFKELNILIMKFLINVRYNKLFQFNYSNFKK